MNELQTGRYQTADKYGAISLVDQYRAEPVKLYNQLTQARDGGIDFLRQVQQLAPEQMPQLGRAYLDAAFDHATESGGFDHAGKLFADWQKLGPETKKILFPAETLPDLDQFFQSAKDAAKVENTSGTARVAHIGSLASEGGGALTLAFFNPLAAAGVATAAGMQVLGGNVLARLLYNPRFVRAAIRGLETSTSDRGAALMAGAKIAAAAKEAGDSLAPAVAASGPPENAGTSANPQIPAQSNGGRTATNPGANPGTTGKSAAVSQPNGAEAGSVSRQGADTVVRVPGQSNGYQARYQVQELGDIQPSHNGLNFTPNPKYALSNDRNYGNAANQAKVVQWGTKAQFDPSFHVTDNPDATNGPIVVDQGGNVLGGNGRAMILQRVYKNNPAGAAAYRDLLTQKAGQFGVDPASIAALKQPVLTRVIPDSEFGPNASKADAITDFNSK